LFLKFPCGELQIADSPIANRINANVSAGSPVEKMEDGIVFDLVWFVLFRIF